MVMEVCFEDAVMQERFAWLARRWVTVEGDDRVGPGLGGDVGCGGRDLSLGALLAQTGYCGALCAG